MKTHRSLWHVIMRTGGPVGGAHRKPPAGAVSTRAKRGIVVLTLALGSSLGAAALALPGHGSAVHVHASTHRPAVGPALSAGTTSTSPGEVVRRPWMY